MARKMPREVHNDLAVMNMAAGLPCPQKEKCVAAGAGCDHSVSHDCSFAVDGVFLPKFAACPFLGNYKKAGEFTEASCNTCRACDQKVEKICAVCRGLHIGGEWTGQKFEGIQTSVPYVFCDTCRIQPQ